MRSLAERSEIIPGRSLTRSKSIFGRWTDFARDCYVIDDDGNRCIDMLCALGAVSIGYEVGIYERWSVYEQWSEYLVPYGVMSFPHKIEVEAAESVLTHLAPWASHARFTVTGSEACHAAYRIAKKATGRNHVLMGDWAYHGWHQWCQDGVVPLGSEPSYRHAGDLPQSLFPDHLVMSFQHGQALWAPEPQKIAAVFIEPHRFEVLPDGKAWLQSVRAFCDRVGALLVFDSMIWGGRHALGGLSEWSGVIPDLECYGKAIGNGMPVACVVGRDALRDYGTMVSGTYSGFPMGLQAVVDTLDTYKRQPVIETMLARGRQLQEGLKQLVSADIGICEGYPVHQRVRFFNEAHGPAFTQAMLDRGVIFHYQCANLMLAHTEAHIDQVLEAARESLKTL